MWSHPFQRQICAIFLSIAFLTYFLSVKRKSEEKIGDQVSLTHPRNTSINEIDEYLQLMDTNSSKEFEYFFDFNSYNNSGFLGNDSKVLHILGLFELTTKFGDRQQGISEMLAAQLAVKHVNKMNVLPGYQIKLLINDTQCDPGVGIDRFFHALYSKKTILMLLGSGCSNVTESLAHVVPYWNILQVSFGSTSPSLSDRNKFPLFFRTVAPDISYNTAKIHFVQEFGWKVVATFSQSENAYLLPLNHLVKELEKVNINCISTVTFSSDNYREQLKVLKDLDTRIIFASFSTEMAVKIFCAIHEMDMFGGEYVWILQDQDVIWWEETKECPKFALRKVLEGIILVSNYNSLFENRVSISGMDTQLFHKSLNVSKENISKYAKQSYDAVWAMALALSKSQEYYWSDSLHEFTYNHKDMVYDIVKKMSQLRFMGLSGPVHFVGADRIGNSVVRQMQGGKLKNVALFDSIRNILDFKCKECSKIYWPHGRIPIAQRILKFSLVKIPHLLFTSVVTFSLLGMVASVLFLYFNLRFRRMKTVKLSSPKLTNVTVVGCTLVYLSVILLGLHNFSIKSNIYFSEMCIARVYLLAAGCSLAFGSMFAKTYRVHRLFTYGMAGLVKDKFLKDKQLIALILIPLIIDALILTLWAMIDPMERNLHNLTLEISSSDLGIVYQPQVEICRSQNTYGWYIALYGYKGLFLIMGAFMAWETRHVKVPGLNDSQYIGICVYSAVFSAIIVVLCSFISDYMVFSYLAKSVSILISTTITLFLLFLPKLKSVFGKVDVIDPVMHSMGLKLESNTRRFITDDPKEVISRLEIQNKVYRYELEALDKEIARLEELISVQDSYSTININLVEIKAECYYLKVPSPVITRASWPNTRGQLTLRKQGFHSDNKLNKDKDRFNFIGKLKQIFGSIPSLQISREILPELNLYHINLSRVQPQSNPEVNSLFVSDANIVKALSENNLNK